MFYIIGKYYNRSEIIDCASTKQQAHHLKTEYRLAFGPNWELWLTDNPSPGLLQVWNGEPAPISIRDGILGGA